MKKILLAAATIAMFSGAAIAAPAAKSYQVTGPVLEMNDTTVTVQKGTEKWQINRGTAAVPADIKVGSKVTIMYTMTATSVESKATPAAKAPAKAK